jgi:hypothetical protein
MSLTSDVGPIKKKKRLINVRHMNAFLIVHGIVYNLSIKLQKGALHDHLGQKQEMNLINIITDWSMQHEERHTYQYMGHILNTQL